MKRVKWDTVLGLRNFARLGSAISVSGRSGFQSSLAVLNFVTESARACGQILAVKGERRSTGMFKRVVGVF